MSKEVTAFHQRIILGVELEGYTISAPEFAISRKMAFPKKGTVEKGERFSRDSSIGTEYNSRPFTTIKEGFFLLKAGLRKYNLSLYRQKRQSRHVRQLLLVGGWRDRFAGAHIHLSIAGKKLSFEEARSFAAYFHDHIPLIIAMTANSPVWADEITAASSTRVLKGSKAYFRPIPFNGLKKRTYDEMLFNGGRKTKPPTLELRVMDSNLPEFILAAACIFKACALAWLRKKKIANRVPHFSYLRSRINAAKLGMSAKLCWNGRWLKAPEYLDRFIWTYREELRQMDIPYEIWDTLKLLRKGMNGSDILLQSITEAYKKHPPSWQRRFAKRYVSALSHLLSGNSLDDYMRRLKVKPPDLTRVTLGRKGLKLI